MDGITSRGRKVTMTNSNKIARKYSYEHQQRRDKVIMDALKAGKIQDVQKWSLHYDADPEGTEQTLASLASALSPGLPPSVTASVSPDMPYDPRWLTPAERARVTGSPSPHGRVLTDN
jgi:hypothetical protein